MSNDLRAPWNDLKWKCVFYFTFKECNTIFKSEILEIDFITSGAVCEYEAYGTAYELIAEQYPFDFDTEVIIQHLYTYGCRKNHQCNLK